MKAGRQSVTKGKSKATLAPTPRTAPLQASPLSQKAWESLWLPICRWLVMP